MSGGRRISTIRSSPLHRERYPQTGADTARARWPARIALVDSAPTIVEFDDDPARRGGTDSITIGRAVRDGTYTWFWATGTRAVATGRVDGDLRVRLGDGIDAWIPAADARLVPSRPMPRAVVGSVTASPSADRLTLRIPLSQRVPYQVVEDGDRVRIGPVEVEWDS